MYANEFLCCIYGLFPFFSPRKLMVSDNLCHQKQSFVTSLNISTIKSCPLINCETNGKHCSSPKL